MINVIKRIEEILERIRANKANDLTNQEMAHYRRLQSDMNQLRKNIPKEDMYREVGDLLYYFVNLEEHLHQQYKVPVSDDTLQKIKALAYFDVLISFSSLFALFTEKEADYLAFLLNDEDGSIAEDCRYLGVIARSLFLDITPFIVIRDHITKRMISTLTNTPLKR